MFGTMLAGLFWERGVAPGATVYLYESLDDDRPIGESLVRWQGAYVRYVPWEAMRAEDERHHRRRLRSGSTWGAERPGVNRLGA